ncbi:MULTISPECIES: WecB/TagA/CpsF family glycosyltransferase [Pseudomonas]
MRISNFQNLTSVDNKLISFVNPHSYLILRNDKKTLNSVDVWLSDGSIIPIIMRFFGFAVTRSSFDYSSIAETIFNSCKSLNKSVAIIGSDKSSNSYFVESLERKYNLHIIFSRDGYFNEVEYKQCLDQLVSLDPDVIVTGMGTPSQEKFLIDLRELGWKGTGFTCGGFIHQTKLNQGAYYPPLINSLNLRFLYRMWKEPRTIQRYLLRYPVACCLIISDLISKRLTGNS